MKTIEEIRAALQHIHAYAMERTGRPYMSIPADPARDADLILSAAIDELALLRNEVATTRMLARALALEEAAQLGDAVAKLWRDAGAGGSRHIFAAYAISEAVKGIRTLAPLPASLVAVPVESLDQLRSVIESIKWDELLSDRELDLKCDQLLALLPKKPPGPTT